MSSLTKRGTENVLAMLKGGRRKKCPPFKRGDMEHFKPIFHCDSKPFVLGPFASPNTKDTNFCVT